MATAPADHTPRMSDVEASGAVPRGDGSGAGGSSGGGGGGEVEDVIPPNLTCAVCLDVYVDPVTLLCGHSLCASCLLLLAGADMELKCPHCRRCMPAVMPPVTYALADLVRREAPERLARRQAELRADSATAPRRTLPPAPLSLTTTQHAAAFAAARAAGAPDPHTRRGRWLPRLPLPAVLTHLKERTALEAPSLVVEGLVLMVALILALISMLVVPRLWSVPATIITPPVAWSAVDTQVWLYSQGVALPVSAVPPVSNLSSMDVPAWSALVTAATAPLHGADSVVGAASRSNGTAAASTHTSIDDDDAGDATAAFPFDLPLPGDVVLRHLVAVSKHLPVQWPATADGADPVATGMLPAAAMFASATLLFASPRTLLLAAVVWPQPLQFVADVADCLVSASGKPVHLRPGHGDRLCVVPAAPWLVRVGDVAADTAHDEDGSDAGRDPRAVSWVMLAFVAMAPEAVAVLLLMGWLNASTGVVAAYAKFRVMGWPDLVMTLLLLRLEQWRVRAACVREDVAAMRGRHERWVVTLLRSQLLRLEAKRLVRLAAVLVVGSYTVCAAGQLLVPAHATFLLPVVVAAAVFVAVVVVQNVPVNTAATAAFIVLFLPEAVGWLLQVWAFTASGSAGLDAWWQPVVVVAGVLFAVRVYDVPSPGVARLIAGGLFIHALVASSVEHVFGLTVLRPLMWRVVLAAVVTGGAKAVRHRATPGRRLPTYGPAGGCGLGELVDWGFHRS